MANMTFKHFGTKVTQTIDYPSKGRTDGLITAVTMTAGPIGILTHEVGLALSLDGGRLTKERKAAMLGNAAVALSMLACVADELGTTLESLAGLALKAMASGETDGTFKFATVDKAPPAEKPLTAEDEPMLPHVEEVLKANAAAASPDTED